jgi:excisionase family DNA binding protein
VVIATDAALASGLVANPAATVQPASEAGTVRKATGDWPTRFAKAAEALGVSRDTVYDELRSGRLASVKIGRRRVITRQHLDDFLTGAATKR